MRDLARPEQARDAVEVAPIEFLEKLPAARFVVGDGHGNLLGLL
jgi:hypothetical protein